MTRDTWPLLTLTSPCSCDRCVRYQMLSSEGTTGGEARTLDVGSWSPYGLSLKDVLFPHVSCGFRGREITVASIDVGLQKEIHLI